MISYFYLGTKIQADGKDDVILGSRDKTEDIFCLINFRYTQLQILNQTAFQKQWNRVSFSTHPHKNRLFPLFLISVILNGVRKYLIVISLIIRDDEHFFHVPVGCLQSSLLKCLLIFSPHIGEINVCEYFLYPR